MSDRTMSVAESSCKSAFVDARADSLLYLGMANYAEYLASPLWESIRKRVLDRENRICRLCGEEASQVHHRSYSKATMLGDRIDRLVALCRECHRWIEFDGDRKCDPKEAEKRFRQFRGKEGRVILGQELRQLREEVLSLRSEITKLRGRLSIVAPTVSESAERLTKGVVTLNDRIEQEIVAVLLCRPDLLRFFYEKFRENVICNVALNGLLSGIVCEEIGDDVADLAAKMREWFVDFELEEKLEKIGEDGCPVFFRELLRRLEWQRKEQSGIVYEKKADLSSRELLAEAQAFHAKRVGYIKTAEGPK